MSEHIDNQQSGADQRRACQRSGTRSTVRTKILVLAFALVVTACLVAISGGDTGAYFSDTKSGVMTGTLGTWSSSPYRLAPGTSKARHWDVKRCQPERLLRIAQYDSSDALFLDFGDAVRGESHAWSDVFRITSMVDDDRAVTFSVTGAMKAFITDIHLRNSRAGVLKSRAMERVYVQIRVPARAKPGDYSGTLTVHVSGWEQDAKLRTVVSVRSNGSRHRSTAGAPCYLEAGTSKAGHWDASGSQPKRMLPIAKYDSSGALFLNLGNGLRGDALALPDAFRLVSVVGASRKVTFGVKGSIAALVTEVGFSKSGGNVLQPMTMQSVLMKINIPALAKPGRYTGTIAVRIGGWSRTARIRAIITVRAKPPLDEPTLEEPEPSPANQAVDAPVETTSLPGATPAPPAPASPTPTVGHTLAAPAPEATVPDGADGV